MNTSVYRLTVALLAALSSASCAADVQDAEGETLSSQEEALYADTLVSPGLPVTINDGANCLDVANASKASGAAIIKYQCNGLKNQQFFFVPVLDSGSPYYQIRTGSAGLCLATDASNNLVQLDCIDDTSRWYITRVGTTNTWSIRKGFVQGGCITKPAGGNASLSVGTSSLDCSNQGYNISLAPIDSIVMRPKHSSPNGMCVDVVGLPAQNNAAMEQYPCTGNDNQRWSLTPVDGSSNAVISTSSGKEFYIKSRSATNQALDLKIGTSELETYNFHGGTNQKFVLYPTYDGHWKIKSSSNGQCLDIAYASQTTAPLNTYTCQSTDNQLFSFGGWHSSSKFVYTSSTTPYTPTDSVLQDTVNTINKTFVTAGFQFSPTVVKDSSLKTSNDFEFFVNGWAYDAKTNDTHIVPGEDRWGSCDNHARWTSNVTRRFGSSLGLRKAGAGSIADFCATGPTSTADFDKLDDTPPQPYSALGETTCASATTYSCSGYSFDTTNLVGSFDDFQPNGGRSLSNAQRLAVRATLYARNFEY